MPANDTTPVRLITRVKGLTFNDARVLANYAVRYARANAPKMSGAGAKRITPYFRKGEFGVTWQDSYMWYQEMGIKAFTMSSLAGKTIPMWIDDPTGKEKAKNPKAETRTTKSGKQQVLIFRKVGTKSGKSGSGDPNNYPGGPGRIALRQAKRPFTTAGKVGGQVAQTNVGVRWRHPGLSPRRFLLHGLLSAAERHHLVLGPVIAVDKYGHETGVHH